MKKARAAFSGQSAAVAIFAAALFVLMSPHVAAQETVLHDFGNGTDGAGPRGSLIFDSAGNLYGTTQGGGAMSYGTVFELTPSAGGGWTETVLYAFSGADGGSPAAGLVLDAAGNLYGTTESGGASGAGTVFELAPPTTTGEPWTQTVLHDFGSGTDGVGPQGSLIFDVAGNLYGTTRSGGAFGSGTVFELTPDTSGGWTESVLHDFNRAALDGYYPLANLFFDSDGSLYGTTEYGALGNHGTVFELTPILGGTWTETLVHPFPSFKANGAYPFDNGIVHAGKFFITTSQGGAHGVGTVVWATPSSTLPWPCRIVHSFNNLDTSDGFQPEAGVVSDASGILYGTTYYGGANAGGTAFELTQAGSVWTESLLHSFGSVVTDGLNPEAGLIFDNAGNLYGTTTGGGAYGGGTIFEITATPTSTSLTSSLNPSIFGQTVTFTATVSSSATPTGKVTFKNGSALLGTVAMTNGVAAFATAGLSAGTKSITAAYGGNGLLFAASTSPLMSQVVTKATISVTLSSSSNPSIAGQMVTFTATVVPQFSGTVTGKVTFKDGNTTLGSVTLSGNVASFMTSALSSGSHKITATYPDNANFSRGTAALTQSVN